jgi:predicted transposase/invertase (TIGR01784 family)
MPKLKLKASDLFDGKMDIDTLSEEEKWCIYFRYRHEDKAVKLIEKLCREEEGIMWAERAAAKADRDYDKFVRRFLEMKKSMDIAAIKNNARREARSEGRAEGLAEGRTETTLEIARKMKTMGEPAEKIQAFTGLPPASIEKL